MPRAPQAEEYYSNQDVLNLLNRSGQDYREQSRYMAEENGRTMRESAGAIGAGMKAGADSYNDAVENRRKRELEQQKIQAAAEQAKADSEFNHEKFASEEAYRTGQSKIAEETNAREGGKYRIDTAANLYASAKTPQEIAAADKQATALKLSPAEIAAAKGVAGQAAAKAVKTPSDAEKNAAIYAKKAKESNDVISQLEDPKVGNYHPEDYSRSLRDFPLTGGVFKSQGDRRYEAAQKEFLAGVLRKESGGAITPAEFSEYGKIYFPQGGDDDETKKLKKASRERAINAMEIAGGDVYNQIPDTSYKVAAQKPSGAVAAPASKSVHEMTKEELEAELKGQK